MCIVCVCVFVQMNAMHVLLHACMYVTLSTVVLNSRDRQGSLWLP